MSYLYNSECASKQSYSKAVLGMFIVISIFIFVNCSGSGGNNGNIFINGNVTNFAQFTNLEVIVLEDKSRQDREFVDDQGNFTLQFRSRTGKVTLRFESDTLNAERPDISVTEDSVIVLNITLQESPVLITINRWQVFQEPIFFRETQLIYNESLVEFNMDGKGNDCIIASGTATIDFRVKSINIDNCREGVRAQSSGTIILEAKDNIGISSNRDAILSLDDSFIRVGQSSSPDNNNILIESANQFGINAAGNSEVIINPQNACSISGSRGAVNINTNASVDTATCTLSEG